jgi:hypothetical protein
MNLAVSGVSSVPEGAAATGTVRFSREFRTAYLHAVRCHLTKDVPCSGQCRLCSGCLQVRIMSGNSGHKSNQVLALDTPLSYDPDNEMIWGDESSNKELVYLRADGTSVRRQSLLTGHITRFNTSYAY